MVSFCKICNAFCEWGISEHIRSQINISNYLSFLISIADRLSTPLISSMFVIGGVLPSIYLKGHGSEHTRFEVRIDIA